MKKPFQIAADVALTVDRSGEIQTWYRLLDSCDHWSEDSICSAAQYALDYCALKLKNTEAFIVACATMTGEPIESFDEKAVRQFIRDLNEEREFVT